MNWTAFWTDVFSRTTANVVAAALLGGVALVVRTPQVKALLARATSSWPTILQASFFVLMALYSGGVLTAAYVADQPITSRGVITLGLLGFDLIMALALLVAMVIADLVARLRREEKLRRATESER